MEHLAQKLVDWIREQVSEAGCAGVVFGLSGGLDSSVVAVLCKRAFPDNTLAVLMPCYSDRTDLDDAQLVARKYAIPTVTVPLDEVFDSLIRALPDDGYDPGSRKHAESNLKPRLRMSTLYYFANRLGYLVVGTGNRSESAVGYSTKHGDSGVDLMPLGNLLKSQVRELASSLEIPGRIIEKPPSAGLWKGQTDESELGLSYEELDGYLASGQATEEVRRKIDALTRAAAHKKAPPPFPPF
jgi:NAD+ synthase